MPHDPTKFCGHSWRKGGKWWVDRREYLFGRLVLEAHLLPPAPPDPGVIPKRSASERRAPPARPVFSGVFQPTSPPPGGWKPPKVTLKLWNDPNEILPGEPLIVEITIANDTDENNVGLSAFWRDHLRLQIRKITEWQDAIPKGLLDLMLPKAPIKIPPHGEIVFHDVVPTMDYLHYWIKKPLFTPGKWKVRFRINAKAGDGLTNEIQIWVCRPRGQDKEVFKYMFGGKKLHYWFCPSADGDISLYKRYPDLLKKEKKEISDFVARFPLSRCAKYARLSYIQITRDETDPAIVALRNKYIKYLRATQYSRPVFPPWLAKYYLPPEHPFLKGLKPAAPGK